MDNIVSGCVEVEPRGARRPARQVARIPKAGLDVLVATTEFENQNKCAT